MTVVFCAAEVFPFVKTGGLGDVCGALPLALAERGVDVSIFLPFYRDVNHEGYTVERVNDGVSKTVVGKGVTVYLIENKDFFDRDGIYGHVWGDFSDNFDRFRYYCLKVLELLKEFNIGADIVHCHDWHAALIPVYLKEHFQNDPFYSRIKSVLTIHNLAHQGVFPGDEYPKLGLPEEIFNDFEFFGKINFLKAGIVYSDQVTTVSPQYAREILTKEFGAGLEGVLGARGGETVGILNGLDSDVWVPATDRLIRKKYTSKNFGPGKEENKDWLQKEVHLPVEKDIPVLGFVGRFSHQKGTDLILDTLSTMGDMQMQVVLLGVGDAAYHEGLKDLAKRFPDKIAVHIEFNEHLGHQIYAGSDFFLMPSRFEPCGLSQMISMHYGTVPVVYKTGGLADTVSPFDAEKVTGNGFVFDRYDAGHFQAALKAAIGIFQDKEKFLRLQKNVMAQDFGWKKSAGEYKKFYQCLLSG